MSKFAVNLKNLREDKQLSHFELAKIIGVSKATISFWENDKTEPTMSNIIKLSRFFNVTSDFLIGLADY